MRAYDIILKKRNGGELTEQEINDLISGYMSGSIPDYQMAAFAMAVYFMGMNIREISALTKAIVNSGEQVDLSSICGKKVDKHSTGGVGDKTTLVLGPLVAAAGVPVAKMSGRGLGHTGGTIDKLESISGFKTSLDRDSFLRSVNSIGIAISGQTGNLAPADKKLYALRDVTATVDSIPLIASSVMSKKIAAGADAIVLDVKVGSGAFMKSMDKAVELAKTMVNIGTELGRKTVAVITNMDEPLGHNVGNANEVIEAIECLKGNGPSDLEELCLTLGSQMVYLAEKEKSPEKARALLEKLLKEGSALAKFKEMVKNQGGNVCCVNDFSCFPSAAHSLEVLSEEDGYVHAIQTEQTGLASMYLGAGRETKDSPIDLSVGIRLNKKVGDQVNKGESIATLYFNNNSKAEKAKMLIRDAYFIKKEKKSKSRLIKGLITQENVEIFD